MKDNDHGNFSTGFIVGILAGATGFFLTQTNEGKEIKEKIVDKWETIKQKLEDEGVVVGNEVGLVDFISNAREKIYKVLGEEVPKKSNSRSARGSKSTRGKKRSKRGRRSKSNSKTSSAKKTPSSRKKMFKGI